MTHRGLQLVQGPPEAGWEGLSHSPVAPRPHSPAALQCVGGRGGCGGGGGGAEGGSWLLLAVRSALSPPALCRVPAQLVGLPPASEGDPAGPGDHWRAPKQAGPGQNAHCGSLFWDGGCWGLPRAPTLVALETRRGLGGVEGRPCLPAWALLC